MTAIPFAIAPIDLALDQRLNAGDLRVLIGLLSYADRDTRECFPKRETLATRIGLSVTRVGQVLTRLADLGWIERTRTGRATRYKITPPGGLLKASEAPQEAVPDALQTRPSATRKPLDQETQGFLSDSKAGVSIASIRRTDHLSDHSPLPPAMAATASPIDQERQRQREREREAQRDQERQREREREAQRDQERQRERERQERQERHQERQERRLARRQERQANPTGSRSEAVRRVLSVFQSVCNVTYPSSGAIAQKVASAIERHGEQVLIRVIKHRGQTFRHPTALLKPELIESINAEIDRPAPPATSHQEGKPKERRIYGIPLSEIERHAHPGESYDDCALRLYEQRRNSVMRA